MWKWILLVAAAVALLVILLSTPFFGIWLQVRQIRAEEQTLSQAPGAQAAGHDLALLCQTCRLHPDWFEGEPPLAPAWTPASVRKFGPTWVHIYPDGARVEYGGGFHHFGYFVGLNAAESTEETGVWTIEL